MIKMKPLGVMALALLAACQHDRSVDNGFEKHDEMNVSIVASIGKQTLNRTISEGNVFTFCANDEIGVFAESGTTYKWLLTEEDGLKEWQSEGTMKWPVEDVADEITFWGYSPYTEAAVNKEVTMPVLSGQTGSLEEIGKYDFLVAYSRTAYNTAGGQVRFVGEDAFKHTSSLVVLQFTGEATMLDAEIQEVLFKGAGIATPTKYVFNETAAEGRIEALSGVEVSHELKLLMNKVVDVDGAKICAVINPLTSGLTLSLTYRRGGITFETKDVTLGENFLPNNMYTYSIKVNKGNVVITGAEITPWQLNAQDRKSVV